MWRTSGTATAQTGVSAGQLAPPAEFRFVDGRVETLLQMRGKPVLVDFWATSCPICLAEMPDIRALQKELAGRFRLVAVAMPYDRADWVLDYKRRFFPELPVALDPMGKIVRAWGPVQGTPTRVLIDRDGRVAHYMVGAVDAQVLRARLLALLNEKPRAGNAAAAGRFLLSSRGQ